MVERAGFVCMCVGGGGGGGRGGEKGRGVPN